MESRREKSKVTRQHCLVYKIMNLAGNGIVTGLFVNLSGGYEGKTLSPFKVIILNGKIVSNENIVSIFWGIRPQAIHIFKIYKRNIAN